MPGPAKEWKVRCLHCFRPEKNEDKVYVPAIDQLGPNLYRVCGYWGARSKKKLALDDKGSFSTLDEAERVWHGLINEKSSTKKGYQDITDFNYQQRVPTAHRVTQAELLAKIDTTRIVGFADIAPSQGITQGEPAKIKKAPRLVPVQEDDRAERGVHL